MGTGLLQNLLFSGCFYVNGFFVFMLLQCVLMSLMATGLFISDLCHEFSEFLPSSIEIMHPLFDCHWPNNVEDACLLQDLLCSCASYAGSSSGSSSWTGSIDGFESYS